MLQRLHLSSHTMPGLSPEHCRFNPSSAGAHSSRGGPLSLGALAHTAEQGPGAPPPWLSPTYSSKLDFPSHPHLG